MNRKEIFLTAVSKRSILVSAVILFILIEAAFSLWLMPGFIEASGGGTILDMAAAYRPSRAADFLDMLEGGAHSWYNRIQFLDFLFPFSYGLSLGGVLYRIYRRKYSDFMKYSWIIAVPLVGAFCDLLENLGIRAMILIGKQSVYIIGWITSVLSTLKFGALALSVLFVLTGFGYFIKGRKDAFKK